MPFYTPVLDNIDYTGPSVTAHPYVHLCRWFFPNYIDDEVDPSVTMPTGGFPWVVAPMLTGFATTIWLDQISTEGGSIFAALLNAGYAICMGRMTVSRSDSIGALQPTSGGVLGASYPGNGVILPPGANPPGYTGSGTAAQDVTRHNPLRDAVMLSQHAYTLAGVRSDLDQSRGALYGSSAGSYAGLCGVLGARNRSSDFFPAPSGQELTDTTTIFKAGIFWDSPCAWWPIYKQDGVGVDAGVRAYAFSVDQSGGGFWDEPALDFEDALASHQSSLSGANIATQAGALADSIPIRLHYGEQGYATNPPYTFNNIPSNSDVETTAHSPWQGQTYKADVGGGDNSITLVLTSNAALTGFETTSLHDELITTGVADVNAAAVAWLTDQLYLSLELSTTTGTSPVNTTATVAPGVGGETISSITYDWGDAESETVSGATLSRSHGYEVPGTYTVTVTVTYDDDSTETLTDTVTVTGYTLPYETIVMEAIKAVLEGITPENDFQSDVKLVKRGLMPLDEVEIPKPSIYIDSLVTTYEEGPNDASRNEIEYVLALVGRTDCDDSGREADILRADVRKALRAAVQDGGSLEDKLRNLRIQRSEIDIDGETPNVTLLSVTAEFKDKASDPYSPFYADA